MQQYAIPKTIDNPNITQHQSPKSLAHCNEWNEEIVGIIKLIIENMNPPKEQC